MLPVWFEQTRFFDAFYFGLIEDDVWLNNEVTTEFLYVE